jgi:hypothetical protein
MAVSAKFIADFSSFETAVKNAEVKLRDFQGSIGRVDKDLTKMSSAFLGDKLLREATLAAKAVEAIGGSAKLTAKEQASLNALVTEAIAKYKALGQAAPESLQKLQKETEKQEGLFTKIKNQLGPIGPAMAAAFSVTAITGAVTKVLSVADALTNLSAKTGISTSGLQKLELAFAQSGVSLDTVTTNVTKLANSLVGGDKGAVAALSKLGLVASDLKKLAPEEQFIKVADAIGGIQNPSEKAYAAMQIFGKGGAELLQGLDGQLAETTKKFEDMGLIISEETVKAADDFGDQLGLVGKQLLGILANAIGPLLPALTALAQAFSVVASVVGQGLGFVLKGVTIAIVGVWQAIADLLANMADLAQRVPFIGKQLGFLGDASAWLHESATKAENMIVKLAFGTEKAGASAKGASTPLIGLGKDIETVGTKAKESTKHVDTLFNAVLNQDMLRQGVGKPKLAELFSDMSNELGKLQAIDLKAWAGVETVKEANRVLALHGLELQKAARIAEQSRGIFGTMFDGFKSSLNDLWAGMSGGKGFAGLMNNLGKGIVDGFGAILSGGLSTVINMGVSMALEGIKKIGSLIGGLFQSEESKHVNKPRDQFFAQFGGYDGLASDLTNAFIELGNTDAGNAASSLIRSLYDADTADRFKTSQQAIADVFSQVGRPIRMMAEGGSGRVSSPTLFMAGEAGSEEYAFSGANRSFGGSSDATARELREIKRLLRDQQRAMALAMRNALALA